MPSPGVAHTVMPVHLATTGMVASEKPPKEPVAGAVLNPMTLILANSGVSNFDLFNCERVIQPIGTHPGKEPAQRARIAAGRGSADFLYLNRGDWPDPDRRGGGADRNRAARQSGWTVAVPTWAFARGHLHPREEFDLLFPAHHVHPAQRGLLTRALAFPALSQRKRPILSSGQ